MEILQAKSVQKAIGLSEAQRNSMNNFAKQYTSQMESYRNELIKTKGKPDNKKVIGFQLALRNHVFSQLSGAQLKRLAQVSLQHDGVSALADDVVAKKMGLSAAQLAKVRAVILSDRKKMQSMEQEAARPILEKYKTVKPKNAAEGKTLTDKFRGEMQAAAARYAPKVQQMVIADRNQIIAVLTPAQKTFWNNLLGKPFSSK